MPANITNKYRENKSSTQAKQGVAKDISGPGTKRIWVECPDPSEGNCEDGDTSELQVVSQPLPKIAVEWHLTKVIMDVEPFKTGNAEKGVPMLQTAAEVTEEMEKILIQESLI